MKPAAAKVQRALDFLVDVPRLIGDGTLEAQLCEQAFGLAELGGIATRLGYETDGEAISEAFRMHMLARQARRNGPAGASVGSRSRE